MATNPAIAPQDDPWEKIKAKDVYLNPEFYKLDRDTRAYITSKVVPDWQKWDEPTRNATIDAPLTYWQEYYKPAPPPEEPSFFSKAAGAVKNVLNEFALSQGEAAKERSLAALPQDFGQPPDIDEEIKKQKEARKPKAKFDPEGSGYDYEAARSAGLNMDETGHWPSRDPKTGLILKGRAHETWSKTEEGERQAGYQIYKKNGRYYSKPINIPAYNDQIIAEQAEKLNDELGEISFNLKERGKEIDSLLPTVDRANPQSVEYFNTKVNEYNGLITQAKERKSKLDPLLATGYKLKRSVWGASVNIPGGVPVIDRRTETEKLPLETAAPKTKTGLKPGETAEISEDVIAPDLANYQAMPDGTFIDRRPNSQGKHDTVKLIGGQPYRVIEPPEKTAEERVMQINIDRITNGQAPLPIPTSRFGNAVMSTMKGFAEGLPANFKSIAAMGHLAQYAMNPQIDTIAATGIAPEPPRLEDSWLWQAAQAIQDKIDAGLPVNPAFQNEFWASMVPQGLGSTAYFMTVGALSSRLGINPLLSTAGGGALVQMGPMYEEAYLSGAPPLELFATALAGIGLGASEAIPINKALKRFDDVTGGFASRFIKNRMRKALEGGIQGFAEEFLQEFSQNIGQDWVSSATTRRGIPTDLDKTYGLPQNLNRPPAKEMNIKEDFMQGLAGGVSGAAMSALMATLGVSNFRNRIRQAYKQSVDNLQMEMRDQRVPEEEVRLRIGLLRAQEKQLIRRLERQADELDKKADNKVKEWEKLTGTKAVMVLDPESGSVISINNKADYDRAKESQENEAPPAPPAAAAPVVPEEAAPPAPPAVTPETPAMTEEQIQQQVSTGEEKIRQEAKRVADQKTDEAFAAAREKWNKLKGEMGQLFEGAAPAVQPAQKEGPAGMETPPLSPEQEAFHGWLNTVSPSEKAESVGQYQDWVKETLPEELRPYAPSYLRAQAHFAEGLIGTEGMAEWAAKEAQRIQVEAAKPIDAESLLQKMPPENLEALVQNGTTDEDLKAIIGKAFGMRGGWGNEDEALPIVRYSGGPHPFFNIKKPHTKEEVKLTGKNLVEAYRKTFGIPQVQTPAVAETTVTPEATPVKPNGTEDDGTSPFGFGVQKIAGKMQLALSKEQIESLKKMPVERATQIVQNRIDRAIELGSNYQEKLSDILQSLAPPEITPAQVPFMITKLDRQSLLDLGWTNKQIDGMTPADAQTYLAQNQGPEAATPAQKEVVPEEFGQAPEAPGPLTETPVVEPVATPPAEASDVRLARRIAEHLKLGAGIDKNVFFTFADEEYGGTRAEGKYGPSEAYDALELGINLYIQGMDDSGWLNADLETAHKTIGMLQDLQADIVSQTNRSGNKELLQQFSTPPAYAYAISWIANVQPGDIVAETSAGTGDIALQAQKMGGEVHANEIDPRRAALLEQIIPNVTQYDAEQIGNILRNKLKPTVVVINPPFSHAGTRMGGKKVIGIDRNHIDAALSLLQTAGRLVAIIGAPLQGGETLGMSEWLEKTRSKYNIRANVQVGRDVYKGYGTTFPTRVLVIDKTGSTPEGSTITSNVENLSQLIDNLEGVRNERKPAPKPSIQGEPVAAGATDVQVPGTAPGGGPGPIRTVPVTTGPVDVGEPSGQPAVAGAQEQGISPEPGGRNVGLGPQPGAGATPAAGAGGIVGGERETGGKEPAKQEPGAGRGNISGEPSVQPGERAAESVGTEPRAVAPQRKLDENVIFDPYTPTNVTLKGAQKHPASVVESSTMAAVNFPNTNYVPDIPESLIATGALSDIQLEFIASAGDNHSRLMPDGSRYGILLGDGTGMGKGRQLAGVILDNWRRGRRKAIWISKNKKLFDETVRDWRDLGQNDKQVYNISKFGGDAEIDIDEGILYSTYDTLRSSSRNGKSRLQQLSDWLNKGDKEFDGVIVFDEAHLMGSLSSERSVAARALQNTFPKARIVYASATAATEIESLIFGQRLGLWGPGTPFPTVEEFAAQIGSSGVSAMEATALSLKAMGRYMARSISFDDGTDEGRVEYERLEHKLTGDQTLMYDRMAEAWQSVIGRIESVLKETKAPGQARGRARANFWSAHQRFFNMMLTSMQMPAVLERIEHDLASGNSVVLQLTNTGEADQERAVANRDPEEDLDDFAIDPFDTLVNLVSDHFPTQAYEDYIGADGKVRTRAAYTGGYLDGVPQGEPIQDAAAVAAKEALLDDLNSMSALMPESPLDMIVNTFGSDRVAEVTGRKRRFTWETQPDGSRKRVEQRRTKELSNKAEINAFQNDKKQILVFSEAGGTGASYHADRRAVNQRKRVHYLVQAGWRADNAIQGLGRTHRSNQRQAPEYVLVHTDLSGQKRFISTIARRLAQLGALTKGQRQASGGGVFTAADNLESQESTDALRQFFIALRNGDVPDITIDDFEAQTGLQLRNEQTRNLLPPEQLPGVTQFLNRLLSMTVSNQNRTFEAFDEFLKEIVNAKTAAGTLDQGVETIKGSNIVKLQDRSVYRHETGAEARYVLVETDMPVKKTTWEKARGYPAVGFVQNNKTGYVWQVEESSVTDTDKQGQVHRIYRLRGPAGMQYVRVESVEGGNYTRMDEEEAKKDWEFQYNAAAAVKKVRHHMISGAVLPIWDRLPTTHNKILRAQTVDGEILIGIDIPPTHIDETLGKLGAEASGSDVDRILQQILDGAAKAQLTNGWTIQRAQVQGEKRIEILGPTATHQGQLEKAGVIVERVGFKYRYFIPTGDSMRTVWDAVTKNRPIAKVDEFAGTAPTPDADLSPVLGRAGGPTELTIGRAETPESIPQAIEAADYWLRQAQDSIDRIVSGEGTLEDQVIVHQNPIIAKHLLNWIKSPNPASWLKERPQVDLAGREVRDYIISGTGYNEEQATAEALHYAPFVEQMLQDLSLQKEGIAVPPEELYMEMAAPPQTTSVPPILPAPPTTSAGATYGPPPIVNPNELISKNDIIMELSRKLKMPIRYGRFRSKALGIFKVDKEVIRLKAAQDIATAAHEVGHAINKLLWGATGPNSLNWTPFTTFRSELEAIATKPRGNQSKLPEGFAEYIRLWVTDPAAAVNAAPRFNAFFESELSRMPALREVLETARNDFARWQNQKGSAMILSNISTESPVYNQMDWFSRFYTGMVDRLHPLQMAVKAIMKGKPLSTEDDPFQLAQALQGWVAKADHFLNRGSVGIKLDTVLGPGLRQILEPVKERLDDLRITAIALRALEKGGIQGIELGISVNDARDALKEQGFNPDALQTMFIPSVVPGKPDIEMFDPNSLTAMTPQAQEIKDSLMKLYKYQDDLLIYYLDAGMMSKETYAKVKTLNQFFVPFHRLYEPGVGEEGAKSTPSGGKNAVNLWMPVRKMKGSWRPVIDPLESIVKNTYTLINVAERNLVGQSLAKLAKEEGAGKWIEGPLPAKMIPNSFALERIKDTLERAGVDIDTVDLDMLATVFVPDAAPSIKENVATVFFDGKPLLYQLEPNLYTTVAGLNQETVDPIIRIASVPASILRAGATGYNPEFASRNIGRDSMTAWLQTEIGFIPGWDTAAGLAHVVKKDAQYLEWLRSGGPHAAMVSMDREEVRKTLQDLLHSPMAYVLHHPLDSLRILSEVSESMTRMGVYAKARKHGQTIRQAGLTSREATLDFQRIGLWLKGYNLITPFLNASIQDVDKFVRVHKSNPKKALLKGSTLALISLIFYYLNKDDDRYKELPWWQRDLFWMIPTKGITGLSELTPWIPIPKPFIWGMAYGTVTERLAEYLDKGDSHAFDDLMKNLAENVLPGVIPTVVKTPIELAFNIEMWRGRNIESRTQQQKYAPEYRANWYTGAFSIQMAQLLAKTGIHISPLKIEHAIFSTTGGTGRFVTKTVLDPIAQAIAPSKTKMPSQKLVDVPIFRVIAVRYPHANLKSITMVEDMWKNIQSRYTSRLNALKEYNRFDVPPLTPEELKQHGILKAATEEVETINREINGIMISPTLSEEEKRKGIEHRYFEMLNTCQKALKMIGVRTTEPIPVPVELPREFSNPPEIE